MSAAVEVGAPEALSAQDEALLEAGKAMIVGSVDVGRELCKTMMTVASGAVPVHVAIVGLAAGKDYVFTLGSGTIALTGAALYLVALCAFAYGYFPDSSEVSLEDLDSLEAARGATISRRRKWARIGLAVFVSAVSATLAAAMYFVAG